ncbi:MAG: hypothetical protein PHO08_04200 [Methylococcales bacterium]|nr:hypothetical protein [Methylococcales bacterium]
MKFTIRFTIAMLFAWFAFLGSAQTAQASVSTYHSGTICKNYNASETARIDYLDLGTRITGGGPVWVICPLVRPLAFRTGATAYVDIYHSGAMTTSCTFTIYDSLTSTPLGSVYATKSFSGFNTIGLTIPNVGRSAYSASVRCYLPGNYNAVLKDIDLIEY